MKPSEGVRASFENYGQQNSRLKLEVGFEGASRGLEKGVFSDSNSRGLSKGLVGGRRGFQNSRRGLEKIPKPPPIRNGRVEQKFSIPPSVI